MKNLFIYAIIIVLISGCVNIKSKYVPLNFYTIQQAPLNNSINTKIDKSIFIKQFDVDEELQTSRIAVSDGYNLIYYNYHLWALPLDELLTNYTINRFSEYNIFTKPVNKSIFIASPDYILECKTNTFKITKSNSENSVNIILTANLYKYNSDTKDYQICFTNNYSKKEKINNFTLELMIANVENIISEITDNMLKDISNVK